MNNVFDWLSLIVISGIIVVLVGSPNTQAIMSSIFTGVQGLVSAGEGKS